MIHTWYRQGNADARAQNRECGKARSTCGAPAPAWYLDRVAKTKFWTWLDTPALYLDSAAKIFGHVL